MNRESGQATVLLFGALLLCIGFAGLAVDGGRLMSARVELRGVADAAALAGASSINEDKFRNSEGADIQLDPDAARSAAAEVLGSANLPQSTHADVEVNGRDVTVRISRSVDFMFLRVTGYRAETIGATATATAATP